MDNDKALNIADPDYAASSWQTQNEFAMDEVPQGLRGWLIYRGLLTRRMRESCRGGFALRVLDQRPADDDELTGGGLCREIALECGPLRAVFARCLIPAATVAAHPFLADLGNAPLGESLTELPDLTRSVFSYTSLRLGQALYQASQPDGAETPSRLFARRSRFTLGDHSLWVCEVFLPAICHCNTNSQ